MREIKFRAWDKEDKRMIVDEQYYVPLMVTNKGVMKLNPFHKENFWEIIDSERFELMQYTGLQDKNGKDVYEGDIIDYPPGLENYHYVVEWCLAGFQLVMYKKAGANCAGISHGMNSCYFEDSLGGEIIGNIHENPELLEVA